jgi:hypothetical protein
MLTEHRIYATYMKSGGDFQNSNFGNSKNAGIRHLKRDVTSPQRFEILYGMEHGEKWSHLPQVLHGEFNRGIELLLKLFIGRKLKITALYRIHGSDTQRIGFCGIF